MTLAHLSRIVVSFKYEGIHIGSRRKRPRGKGRGGREGGRSEREEGKKRERDRRSSAYKVDGK